MEIYYRQEQAVYRRKSDQGGFWRCICFTLDDPFINSLFLDGFITVGIFYRWLLNYTILLSNIHQSLFITHWAGKSKILSLVSHLLTEYATITLLTRYQILVQNND